jgi:hypothetical protein
VPLTTPPGVWLISQVAIKKMNEDYIEMMIGFEEAENRNKNRCRDCGHYEGTCNCDKDY